MIYKSWDWRSSTTRTTWNFWRISQTNCLNPFLKCRVNFALFFIILGMYFEYDSSQRQKVVAKHETEMKHNHIVHEACVGALPGVLLFVVVSHMQGKLNGLIGVFSWAVYQHNFKIITTSLQIFYSCLCRKLRLDFNLYYFHPSTLLRCLIGFDTESLWRWYSC